MKRAITIELRGHEMDDGRIYLDSPDLKGFHYVLEKGQDIDEITDDLTLFATQYLKAEISRLIRAETPRDYLHRKAGAEPERRMFRFAAEVTEKAEKKATAAAA